MVEADVVTERLAPAATQDNVVVLKFGPEILSELSGMAEGKQMFDAILIDVTECGFLFTADVLIEAAQMAKNLLQLQGAMVFLKSDKAVAIVRDSLTGLLSFFIFDSYAELFDHSPSLAKHIRDALGSSFELAEESTDLSQQVLMTAVPILTSLGIKLKAGLDSDRRRNLVLTSIDSYTPISTISHRLVHSGRLTLGELMEELKALEQAKAIYPIFPRIPFLVDCFKNHTSFGLKDYLVAAKLMTQEQVDDMLAEIQATPPHERLSLGPLVVKRGYINGRQLAVALHEQAFYGQGTESEQQVTKVVKRATDSTQVNALVGHLGTTDPSNLLQNIVQNRETGVLSVEFKDQTFKAHFEMGKVTHAKVGNIEGNKAVIEFVSAWKEGIFVFIQRQPPPDLAKDSCQVTRILDKLLLDSALAKDNMDVVLKKLPKGIHSVLEKLPDEKGKLAEGKFVDPKEKTPLKPEEVKTMQRLWEALDGLTSLFAVIRSLGNVPSCEACYAADVLLDNGLVSVANVDLAQPLQKFQLLLKKVTEKIGKEKSSAYIRLSLRDTIGYSGHARMYVVSPSCEVGVDMVAARATGTPLSTVIKDLENWQVKYIEYVSQDINPETLMNIIREVHPDGVA
ncbi:MAG TPA: DUF4388 domain-containing protein [Candidatus Obscuribacterales bacterium]